jgi:hypothetical protein
MQKYDLIGKYQIECAALLESINTIDNLGYMYRENHAQTGLFAVIQEGSAHLSMSDCFECLPPRGIAA